MATTTFDFSSGEIDADTTFDGDGRASASQTISGHTLTLTANRGLLSVLNEDEILARPDPVFNGGAIGKILAVDVIGVAPTTIRLSLDNAKMFDLTALTMLDLNAGDERDAIVLLVIKTNHGDVEVPIMPQAVGQGIGQVLVMPDDARLKGVLWAEISDSAGRAIAVELDDIVLSNVTIPVPPQTPGAPDLAADSDSGTSNTDNVTNATSLAFSGTNAAADDGSTVTVFIDTNGDGDFDAGEASATGTAGAGTWSVSGLSTTSLSGTYNAYAFLTSATGSLTSPLSTALQLKLDRSAPTTSFSNVLFSSDTGTSSTDRETSVAGQTITATLSQTLGTGEKLEGSLDNGSTWTNITSMVSGTSLTWTGATLVAGGGIRLRVTDEAGNAGMAGSFTYKLDQTAPTTTMASALFSTDSGNDFIVNTATQTLSGTLSANLAAGEQVEVSLNNGATWSTASATTGSTAWSISGITLASSNTLQLRVKDAAGNSGTALTKSYVLDTAAPTASTAASTQLLAPTGANFTVTVTYADTGGAGIDTATFGTGNIGVTGPLGANLAVLGFAASGSTVTYTVQAPGGSWDAGDAGAYTVAIKGNSVLDVAGNAVAANAGAGTVDVVFSTAPGVSALRLSADSGSSNADFVTNVAAQTIGATLSRPLTGGEVLQGSLDNGATWTNITAKLSGTELAWDGVTLPAGGTLVVRALDGNGLSGTPASQAYTVDTAAPAQSVASAALAADSGLAGDFVTNVAAQTLSGTLSAPLGAGDFVEVSFDNGASWTTAAAIGGNWSLGGVTLAGAGTLQVRVSDLAGNRGSAWTQSYLLDTAAPTAGTPVRANLVDPSGASFTFTVTYADSGAGIDPATIGAGNVSVTGPGGTLSILGASASGNTVTYTVAAPGGSWDLLDSGSYTIGINAQVKDLAGNTVAANAAAGSFGVSFAAPAVGALGLSLDSGSSATDFITNSAAQTVGATLSRALIAGETVQGSLDNGATWTDITAKISGTTLAWDGVTLPASGTLVVRVLGTDGNAGTAASQAYVLDTQAPLQTVATAALSADSGVDGDFITNAASQALAGTLSAALGAGEFVEVSLDNGGSWTTAAASGNAWNLGGFTLPASGTLQVRVSDIAGNQGTAWTQAYRVDTTAPTAAAPVRADMVDPSGASFTFTVTYTDSGVGIDPATIGAGNVSVTGPGGALNVLGVAVSGNTVTYTVEAPGGGWDPADSGSYTIGVNAQVKDLAGNAVAANAAAGSFAVSFAAPAVGALGLSLDSGSSATDFITNSAAQTVGATLSRALIAGEIAQGSLDNGATWTDITAKISGTTLAWDGVTLAGSGTLVVRVLGTDGAAGTPASHAYTLDTATPAQSIASAALAVDSAVAGDFITNVAAQTLSGTLSAPLGAGDFVEVSLDNGASWTAAAGSGSTWSLGGITLAGAGTLKVRVSDLAGNQGTAWTQAYQVDTAAPTVGTPVRANLVDPSGTSFSFTVTYADGGAGIDPATIGAGNVSVTGPGAALNVLGVAVSGNTVTYTVEAPGGSWDPLDAGSYTIGINAQVKDLAGNTVAANAAAHSFTVGVNSAPTLGGVFATPAIADDATASPFAGVTVADLDGDALTLTIAYTAANGTLSGTGLSGSAGNYTLSGSAAEVQAALRGLVFTPTANQSAGAPVATSFTLSASDGSASTSNSATVVSAAPVAPTATVGLSDTDLRAGESATLTLNFSEAVTGLDAGDLTLTGLSLGALESSNGGRTWTATVTPAAGIASASHQVLLDLAGVLDAGGLAGSGVVTGPGYTIRTLRPTATLSVDDISLTAGEAATLSITFSEAVTGFSLDDLTVDRGTLANLASSDGGITWTATLTPAPGVAAATNTVRLDLTGVQNAAGNAGSGVATSNTYAVATAPDEPAPPAGGTVDGVPVDTSSYTDPATGLVNQAIGVPVVSAGRTDDPNSPNAPLADIPLTAVGGGASSTLTVSLPVGAGLQANGPASLLGKGEALLDLIRRIEQKTVQGTDTREQMTGEGSGFLDALASGTMLHTATVAPVSTATTDSVLVTGGAAGGTAIGIVIDATGLNAGTTLRLDNVDFAAVVGGATLRGGMGNNIVVGDGASQNIFLGEGDDQLFGGGGDDVIGSAGGDDLLDGGSGKDFLAGGIGNDRLVGGSGDDVLQGGRSSSGAWQFTLGANGALGAVHQTAVFAPGAQETLALAELDRGSAELAFLSSSRATLTDMALLYQAAFERAPDIAGLNFYLAKGVDAAAVARSVVASAEWSGDGTGALSDAAFVQRLYSTVFEREGDSAGVAFWTGKLAGGALSRADALLAFALADEHRALHADSLVVAAADVQRENGGILGSGDDRLEGGAGSDLLVGGDGTDTVVYAGKLADYRFLLGADGAVKVADKANADVDTLFGIELGEFSDGTVDLGFTQAGAATLEAVGLLYQTLLDRAGDLGGLSWWAGSGLDRAQLVTGFTASSEFTARYDAMSDAAFVAALYANSGLDASAAGGSAAWVNMLQHHSRAELIGSWIGQQDVLDAHLGNQGLWLL